MAHWFKSRGVPVLGPAIARWSQFLTGVDIAPAAKIGPGLRIAHGTGIVVGNGVRIGRDCLLMHGVTLGAPTTARIERHADSSATASPSARALRSSDGSRSATTPSSVPTRW